MLSEMGGNGTKIPTRREHELMRLIARGLQNKSIAYELKISEHTVRAHICNIMRKYGLQNRTQIAMMFVSQEPPQRPPRRPSHKMLMAARP